MPWLLPVTTAYIYLSTYLLSMKGPCQSAWHTSGAQCNVKVPGIHQVVLNAICQMNKEGRLPSQAEFAFSA